MKDRRPSSRRILPAAPARRAYLAHLALGCLLLFVTLAAQAGPGVRTGSPIGFFTNIASRLLQSELGLSLTNIQVYPANQYSPAVHRLLQVTANLYDATTNQATMVSGTNAIGMPTIFRPLFRRTPAGQIFIAAYREVTDASLANASTAPPMVDLENGSFMPSIPPFGAPFGPERTEPLVYGLPLVVGAKKGLPNFNEFSTETMFFVTRKLEFRRSITDGPITETNQMFIVGISNAFGVEAWNSYTNAFAPATPLKMTAVVDLDFLLTNEFGIMVSNRLSTGLITNISNWPGYLALGAFQVPLSNTVSLLPPPLFQGFATYSQLTRTLVPLSSTFERGMGLQLPHWWLNLSTRMRFILVAQGQNAQGQPVERLIDYVNLSANQPPIDIFAKLSENADCNVPNGSFESEWCPNIVQRLYVPQGVINQIMVGRGTVPPTDWQNFIQDPITGSDRQKAIAFFLYQLTGIQTPGYGPFNRTNIFYAPFDPWHPLYQHVVWQANDPLVHYLVTDFGTSSSPNFVAENPPGHNLGFLNQRYEPWGGNPFTGSGSPTKLQAAVKDPLVTRSDDWNFPTSEPLNPSWLGRVHRGTPWQTLYLKSSSIDAATWQQWVGLTYYGVAQAMYPVGDRRLVSLLVPLFNTNDLRQLASVNQPPGGWPARLDGLVVLTNSTPDYQFPLGHTPPLDSLIIQSNSAQAAAVATAINALRAGQPGQVFRQLGDILATPELSLASPWLNRSNFQTNYGIPEEAYEIIPSQLLGLLRTDSIGSLLQTSGAVQVQFTGLDDYLYAVQVSPNLIDWTSIATNSPANGVFNFVESPPPGWPLRFYRSVLLP